MNIVRSIGYFFIAVGDGAIQLTQAIWEELMDEPGLAVLYLFFLLLVVALFAVGGVSR